MKNFFTGFMLVFVAAFAWLPGKRQGRAETVLRKAKTIWFNPEAALKKIIIGTAWVVLSMFLFGCDPKDFPARSVQICNENSYNVRYILSVGYFDKVADDWISKGWWHIEPGDCVTPINARHGGKVYIHGRYSLFKSGNSSDGSFLGDVGELLGDMAVAASEQTISGNYIFCSHPTDAFTVNGDTRCVSRGYRNQGFHKIDISSWQDTLIEFYNGKKYKLSYQ